jgi:dTDP-glucose 4,6-dehydratase
MAWLVTGGAGFIGCNFVRAALAKAPPAKAPRLVVFDALTYAGNLANLADVLSAPNVTLVRGDICDPEAVARVFAEHAITHVIHFAAESHVDRSILGSAPFIRTNVLGTHTLLEAARTAWGADTAGKRFVHVSTDEVFGTLAPGDPPFEEATAHRPNSPYAASKAGADHLVRAWFHTYGLPTLISNCSNNFGPWQFPEKLIPLMIVNALEEKPLPIYGDGRQVRDWLYVQDHCEALLAILERGVPGEAYCVGGNNERANLDIVDAICTAVDAHARRAPGTTRKLIRHVTDRPGHDRRYAINAAKIQRELGWSARFSFGDTLPGLVAWYAEHKLWADDIRSGQYLKYYAEQYGARG